jgi:hypothetical protein
MDFMNGTQLELIGLGLFVASEIIGMSKLKSNSVLQLLLMAARQAFPYGKKPSVNPLDKFLGK